LAQSVGIWHVTGYIGSGCFAPVIRWLAATALALPALSPCLATGCNGESQGVIITPWHEGTTPFLPLQRKVLDFA